jgi:hypothetical protein
VNGTNSVTEKVANKKENTVKPKSVKSTEVSAETQTKAAPLPKEEEITDSDD